MNISNINFYPEFIFKTSRSSGSGGQNVNKVSTKVELNFVVKNSNLLTVEQKQKIISKQKRRINKEGNLQIVVQTSRSQLQNKNIAIKKFYELIENCFIEKPPRIPTQTSQATKQKRLKEKKINSERKKNRKIKMFDV